LDGGHYIGLLREERVPQIGRPLNITGHALQDFRSSGQRLYARIPILLCDCLGERLVFDRLVLRHPLLDLDNLERIRRSGQDVRQQLVGIQRDRRD
jgi:hypothetical protein